MKKCIRCDVVFQFNDRTHCIYCDALLITVSEATAGAALGAISSGAELISKLVKDKGRTWRSRSEYIIGSYFRTRTFRFMYFFSRNEFKLGKGYPRILIQPLSAVSFLSLPWVLYNIADSVIFWFRHSGYCEKCKCKYVPKPGLIGHETNECEYNREYFAIVTDILNGRITQTEERYYKEGAEKFWQGRRSAYLDLCKNKEGKEAFWDILSIWFSVCVILTALVWITLPWTIRAIQHLESLEQSEQERRESSQINDSPSAD
ncbi:MAG: hypothetical protein Q8Q08_03160 [Candidatus Omnitrophota bacterium]|nr:hypothetical protein [Candidatus Omnitrophota bacterium]MDZ4241460.1 hypothetical protein [Candidatus Omnitrophota bacterium]